MPDDEPRNRRGAHDPEARRVAFAAERAADLAERELALLTRATEASDDDVARELECDADTAYRNFIAITKEHGLDP
jgi:hypothetical protein